MKTNKVDAVHVNFIIPFNTKENFNEVISRVDTEMQEKREEIISQLAEKFNVKLVWNN